MLTNRSLIVLLVALGSLAGCMAMGARDDAYAPAINPANFQAVVDNPYFPLIPGTRMKVIEKKGDEVSENIVAVTHDTKTILGVPCTVVHDTVSQNGAIEEETYDWYAQDKQGNVWYFGENTLAHKPGGHTSNEGSWEAGVGGAQPGIVMPAVFKVGEAYRQEYLAGHAEDMGKVMSANESVTVPAGAYSNCVRTDEWSMLESGTEKKWYCKGIGFVREVTTAGEVVELVSVTRP